MVHRSKSWFAGIVSLAVVCTFVVALRYTRELPQTTAQSGPNDIAQIAPLANETPYVPCDIEDPACNWGGGEGGGGSPSEVAASIVFVIDGSETMFPRLGPNYFDLAKNAIIELLDRPSFPLTGEIEISVIQFADREARDSRHLVHWLRPVRITHNTRDIFRHRLQHLKRSQHHSANLMEIGVRDAAEFFIEPQGVGCIQWSEASLTTEKHIVLLTTGEYRVSSFDVNGDGSFDSCPPADYSYCLGRLTGCVMPSDECRLEDPSVFPPPIYNEWHAMFNQCQNPIIGGPGSTCNRACAIRYQVWKAREQGIRVSAVHLGNDWREMEPANLDQEAAQVCDAYPDGVCIAANGGCNPITFTATANCPEPDEYSVNTDRVDYGGRCFPKFPDRGGFLRELTHWRSDATCTPGPNCSPIGIVVCDLQTDGDPPPPGMFHRLEPIICSDCAARHVPPGSSSVLSGKLVEWICRWMESTGTDSDLDGIVDLCDNCPHLANYSQQDCNRDAVGDWCQTDCLGGTNPAGDTDDDDLCNALDLCSGGDDCLIADWKEQLGCAYEDLLPMTAGRCNCDCDNNGTPDLCQAAIESGAESPPCTDPAICSSIPETCDAMLQHTTSSGAAIRIDDFNVSSSLQSWLPDWQMGTIHDQNGWWVGPADREVNPSSARIVVDPTDLAGNKVLELRLSPNLAQNGDEPWFVEGPGLIINSYGVASVVGNQVEFDPFGVIAVEMDLWADNGCGGTDFDIYILDPCVDDFEFAKRVHLKLRPVEAPSSTTGAYFIETYSYGGWSIPEAGLVPAGDSYPLQEWFTLKFLINVGAHFTDGEGSSAKWNGNGASVHIWQTTGSLDSPTTEEIYGSTTNPITELGPHFKNQTRGFQIRIESNNRKAMMELLPIDNCPNNNSLSQVDSDLDGWGDACDAVNTNSANDPDPDADGVFGEFDNCPTCFNPRVAFDRNATGTPICALNDWNLPDGFHWQPDQDCDGIGDECDKANVFAHPACCLSASYCTLGNSIDCTDQQMVFNPYSNSGNRDCDFVNDNQDNCPFVRNPITNGSQPDQDGDGVGDDCDNCFSVWNKDQADRNRDGFGDACEPLLDTDQDGVKNDVDICPYTALPNACGSQGKPNDADDADVDGINNSTDKCFSIPNAVNDDTDSDKLGNVCDSNTHITDCDDNGTLDHAQWSDWFAGSTHNPCVNSNRSVANNDGHCMCLASGHAFMHTPNLTVLNALEAFRGGPDGGVCLDGPCGPGISCDDTLRVRKFTIRKSCYDEWNEGNLDKSVCQSPP